MLAPMKGRAIAGSAMSAEDRAAPLTHKHCNKCDTTRPIKFFCTHKLRKDGYQPWCKFCSARYVRDLKRARKAAAAEKGAA